MGGRAACFQALDPSEPTATYLFALKLKPHSYGIPVSHLETLSKFFTST